MEDTATILYVEDNPDNRILILRILNAEGYEVLFAENAEQAMETAQQASIDLILMDINLPDVDGYTLTSQIRALPNIGSIPIIALTANVMKGDRERSLEAGCDGYIQKPVDVDNLPVEIAAYLRKEPYA
ncbi:MAG: response regulator [Chloroflexi bacterium]|nr:MAG: response regulator [Chloroflexota bacterium]MBL1194103.1 response regulator [Chloroflexota bacterium]NOH11397.1 response regulator [Chloroflexota bacterium]